MPLCIHPILAFTYSLRNHGKVKRCDQREVLLLNKIDCCTSTTLLRRYWADWPQLLSATIILPFEVPRWSVSKLSLLLHISKIMLSKDSFLGTPGTDSLRILAWIAQLYDSTRHLDCGRMSRTTFSRLQTDERPMSYRKLLEIVRNTWIFKTSTCVVFRCPINVVLHRHDYDAVLWN